MSRTVHSDNNFETVDEKLVTRSFHDSPNANATTAYCFVPAASVKGKGENVPGSCWRRGGEFSIHSGGNSSKGQKHFFIKKANVLPTFSQLAYQPVHFV